MSAKSWMRSWLVTPRSFDRLSRRCFVATGLIVAVVLLSWTVSTGSVTLPGRVDRPMAPLTAWILFGLAVTLFRLHLRPDDRWARRSAAVVGGLVFVAGTWVIVTVGTDEPGAFPIGVMTPVAAVVLMTAAAASLLASSSWKSRVQRQVEATLGLLVAFAGLGVLLGHVMNVPTALGQPMPAASTGVAFFTLGLGIGLGRAAHAWPDLVVPSLTPAERRARARTLALGVGMAVGACAALIAVFAWVNAGNQHGAAQRLLATAANEHAREIAEWFEQRSSDAEALARNPLISDELRRLLGTSDSTPMQRDVLSWMESLTRSRQFLSVVLVDPAARIRFQVPPNAARTEADEMTAARTILTTGETRIVDAMDTQGSGDRLSWVVPLGGTPPVAALIMVSNPEQHLWPDLNRWFDRTSSAEVVMIRQDGDDVVFLNAPHQTAGAPRRLRMAEQPWVPAIRALTGESGEVYALDYRGVPVIAAMRRIERTPWALVLKVDQREVDTQVWHDTWLIAVTIGAVFIVVMLSGVSVWLRREAGVSRHVAQLATAIAQTPMSVVITDLTGAISYVNPMFTTVTGYTSEEAIGQNPRILKSGTHDVAFYRQLWDTVATAGVWTGEIHNRRKTGELFWESATISQLRNERGELFGYVAIKRDITAEKQGAIELDQVRAQLTQAQKMESVGRLAGGVAHDFNNMLAVILGHAEIALEGLSEHDQRREHLVEILQAGQRSADLTRQLLAFARKQAIRPKVVDLNDSVGNMLKMLRRLIGENIEVRWVPGPDLWPVHIDPAQVDQILANLSVNARDAIAGGGVVTITTANVHVTPEVVRGLPRWRVGEFVELTISDSGCGMTPDVLSHLFEPFFTTKEAGKGTGLGTATVYGIVTQNQGFIHVDSTVGVGTHMRVFLPRVAGHGADVTTDAPMALPMGTETVLLVEDEPAMLETCRRMLVHLGYTVLPCQSPEEAQTTLVTYTGRIHLLLTDVVMPGGSGRDLAEATRRADPSIKVLFMSGYTAELLAGTDGPAGGVGCLAKPFSTAELATKLREALS
jgi:PAS domain S-box-containing protein